jgi:hypothetical protein
MTIANAAAWQTARKIHKTVIRSFQVGIETTSRRVARLPERAGPPATFDPFTVTSTNGVTAEAKGFFP